jgi:TPR repeat protein
MRRHFTPVILLLTLASSAFAQSDKPSPAPALGNPSIGEDWLRELAMHGNPDAQTSLGYSLEMAEKPAEALEWYQRSAEQGDQMGQFRLGRLYLVGSGVPQDYSEALTWLKQSAAQGHPTAQILLSSMYADGQGGPADDVEAVKWARRAAEQDCTYSKNKPGFKEPTIPEACAVARASLGASYLVGRGVPEDHVLAYMWLNLAAASMPAGENQRLCTETRDGIAARLTPRQLAYARRLSREWTPRPSEWLPRDGQKSRGER